MPDVIESRIRSGSPDKLGAVVYMLVGGRKQPEEDLALAESRNA
jgi:hypothetical protein